MAEVKLARGTKGMHCVRYKQTRRGKRCAKYSK